MQIGGLDQLDGIASALQNDTFPWGVFDRNPLIGSAFQVGNAQATWVNSCVHQQGVAGLGNVGGSA